jgi:hypothetical protein
VRFPRPANGQRRPPSAVAVPPADAQGRPAAAPQAAEAWAGAESPPPPTLSAEDDRFLASIALAVERRGLVTPAVLWLEGLRPLSYLGSQALWFCEPLLQALVPSLSLGRLAGILEERSHLERLIQHIEAAAARPAVAGPPASGGAS